MSIPSTERMTAIADKGAQPTSAEVNWALRELVHEEISRLDRSEKSPNDALTPYGRFAQVCLKRWLEWLDLPDTRHQLVDVVRIVEAMEHDLLRHPPKGEVAAILPMRDAFTLYRVACGWIGHEPRVAKLEIEEAACGQHFGSADHPNRYVCELPAGHDGLHAAPSVNLRQHAEPVRMELLGGGLTAEIGPVVMIGEEIAQQLNAGIEPATGRGTVNVDLKMVLDTRCGAPFGTTGKPKEVCALRWDHSGPHAKEAIRIDDLPEPTREECEADAKLHEEIIEKMAREGQDLDPDEVQRQVLNWDTQSHDYDSTILVEVARAWLAECRQVEILNEVAMWGERFCTSGRYEPTMMPQRGLYRALLRLQAVRTGGEVPPPFPEPDDDEGSLLGERHAKADQWQQAALRVGEELDTPTPEGYYTMTPEKWLRWAMYAARAGAQALNKACRLAEYISSNPSRFRGSVGRDAVDVAIDALKASGEQRGGISQPTAYDLQAFEAHKRRVRREAIACELLSTLIGDRDTRYNIDSRAEERRAAVEIALAWADSLIELVDRNEVTARR